VKLFFLEKHETLEREKLLNVSIRITRR